MLRPPVHRRSGEGAGAALPKGALTLALLWAEAHRGCVGRRPDPAIVGRTHEVAATPGFRAARKARFLKTLQQLTLESCRKPPALPQPPAVAYISRKHCVHFAATPKKLQVQIRGELCRNCGRRLFPVDGAGKEVQNAQCNFSQLQGNLTSGTQHLDRQRL